MGNAEVFTLLRETINPIMENVNIDRTILNSPLLGLFNMELIDGVQQPDSAEIDIFAYKSYPAIIIGDRRAYEAGNRDMDVKKIKAKFYTQNVRATEDDVKRIRQNQGRPTRLIERGIEDQMKRQNEYYIYQVEGVAINGLTSGAHEDNAVTALFAGSSDGTLANPSDLNATAGTALDLSAFNFSGTNQIENALVQLINEIKTGFVKIDTNTGQSIMFNRIYLGVPDFVYEIFDSNHDVRNSTTGERDPRTMKEQLEASNIFLIKNQQFDTSYTAKTSGATSTIPAFADPEMNCHMFVVPDGMGEDAWTDWDDIKIVEGNKMTVSYERHKSKEIGFWPQAYWISSDDEYFKMVFRVKITPYENS